MHNAQQMQAQTQKLQDRLKSDEHPDLSQKMGIKYSFINTGLNKVPCDNLPCIEFTQALDCH